MAEQKVRARRVKTEPVVPEHMEAPQKLKLLITVVNEQKAEFYMDLIQSYAVNMQFCTTAQGTATMDILHLMGLESAGKMVICSLVREDTAARILPKLEEKFHTIKNGKGIALTIPLSGMIGVSIYQFLCDNRKGVKEGL